MNINYSLYDPNGNITALVESEIETSLYPYVAKEVMNREPSCEQVGFVSGRTLRMAGGEFCGNASLCAASRLALNEGLFGEKKNYRLTVSGADEPVSVQTQIESDTLVSATVTMPKAVCVRNTHIDSIPVTMVDFRGITHAVCSEQLPIGDAERLIKRLCAEDHADAFGLIFFDPIKKSIRPLVYVPVSDTLFWESSCASGTAAAGIALSQNNGCLDRTTIRQPKGALDIAVKPDGTPLLSGTAEFIKSDVMILDFS